MAEMKENVHHRQRHPRAELVELQISRVDLLQGDNTGIPAELPIQLMGAHVDGKDLARAALQEAVREPARRGADVQAGFPFRRDPKMRQRSLQLHSTAAHVPERLTQQAKLRFGIRQGTALLDFLLVDQHLARQDHGLRLGARLRQAALNQQPVQADSYLPLLWHPISTQRVVNLGQVAPTFRACPERSEGSPSILLT